MMKRILVVLLTLSFVFGLMINSAGAVVEPETPAVSGRVTGGGQIRTESGVPHRNGRDINYKISFGIGAFCEDGVLSLHGTTVVFHNVSDGNIKGGKFMGEELTEMNFFADGSVANYTVLGRFNNVQGYKMIIRVEDAGEPGREDSIRFELYQGSTLLYDSLSDFVGESENTGTARHLLDKGNLQVETY